MIKRRDTLLLRRPELDKGPRKDSPTSKEGGKMSKKEKQMDSSNTWFRSRVLRVMSPAPRLLSTLLSGKFDCDFTHASAAPCCY